MKFKLLSPGAWFFLGIATLFIVVAVLSGCATPEPIVKVDKMVACDDGLDKILLQEPCDAATKLPDGAVFQDALKSKKDTNASLTACSVKVAKLQQALSTCHAAVVNHNQVIDSLNKK